MQTNEKVEELTLKRELGKIELGVIGNFTIADAIREGSLITDQEYGWGLGDTACALHAAVISAKSRGFI